MPCVFVCTPRFVDSRRPSNGRFLAKTVEANFIERNLSARNICFRSYSELAAAVRGRNRETFKTRIIITRSYNGRCTTSNEQIVSDFDVRDRPVVDERHNHVAIIRGHENVDGFAETTLRTTLDMSRAEETISSKNYYRNSWHP